MEQDAVKAAEKSAAAPLAADMDVDQFLDGGFMDAAGSEDEELDSSDESLGGEGSDEEDADAQPLEASGPAAVDDGSSSDGAIKEHSAAQLACLSARVCVTCSAR